MNERHYVGSELLVFASAANWKRYWMSRVAAFVAGDVLEVGAGIGSNTALLRSLSSGKWLCLEPDPVLLEQCVESVQQRGLRVDTMLGTEETLPEGRCFDTALYIDVLEHIEDDAGELSRVARHVRSHGHIVVLSPAHQRLYNEFDRAVGHVRRYDRQSLARCSPATCTMRRCEYLDSVGYFFLLGNRFFLKQAMPALKQILVWDCVGVPLSRVVDPLTGFRFGKSILAVWQVQ